MNNEKSTPTRVVICGAYGMGNLGDEAVLGAIISELRAIEPECEITVISRTPQLTEREHGVRSVYTFDMLHIGRELERAHALVHGGGSLIQNATSRRSLAYYLEILRLAKASGCRTLMYGCGIGPVSGQAERIAVSKVLNDCADCICVRDEQSQKLLSDLGVTAPEIILSADPVLSLSACSGEKADEFLRKAGLGPDEKFAIFALRPWKENSAHMQAVAKTAEFAYNELGLKPVFMTLDRGRDLECAQKLAKAINAPSTVLPKTDDAALAIGVMQKAGLVIAMRLHAVIFAAMSGAKTVAVSYDPKIKGFCDYTESAQCVELGELSEGALIDAVYTALRTRPSGEKLARAAAFEKENALAARRIIFGEE